MHAPRYSNRASCSIAVLATVLWATTPVHCLSGAPVSLPRSRVASWTESSAGLPSGYLDTVAVDPTDASRVYAMSMDGSFFRSGDAGRTWRRMGPRSEDNLSALAVDGTGRVLIGAGKAGGFISRDNGASFVRVAADPEIHALFPLSDDGRQLLAATPKGLLKSIDSGKTWLTPDGWPHTFLRPALATDASRSGFLVMETEGSEIVSTRDGGQSWSHSTPFPKFTLIHSLAAADGRIYAMISRDVLRSTDGAATFRSVGPGLPTSQTLAFAIGTLAVSREKPAKVYATTTTAGLFRVSDDGSRWLHVSEAPKSPRGTPGSIRCMAVSPSQPARLYVGLAEGGVSRSDDGGQSWSRSEVGLECPRILDLAYDMEDPVCVYTAVLPGGVLVSRDGGSHWQPRSIPTLDFVTKLLVDVRHRAGAVGLLPGPQLFQFPPRGGVIPIPLSSDDPSVQSAGFFGPAGNDFLICRKDGSVQRLDADTDKWTTVCEPTARGTVRGIVADHRTALLMEATEDRVRVSSDGGRNWSPTSGLEKAVAVRVFAAAPSNPAVCYLADNAGRLFRSADRGVSWEVVAGQAHLSAKDRDLYSSPMLASSENTLRCLEVDTENPQLLYGARNGGVEISEDGGRTWNALGQGLERIHVTCLALAPHGSKVLLAGSKSGIYRLTLP